MGHICQILTFKEKNYTKSRIQAECDDWGNCNADFEERGCLAGLGSLVNFTSRIFETQKQAEDYLESTFGNYRQIAVRYKVSDPKKMNTKTIQDLKRRIAEYRKRITELNKPHYQGVKSKTVKCKHCEAVLPTSYCGKSYMNRCPICKEDLRPASVLDKEKAYKKTVEDLSEKLDAEIAKLSQTTGYELYWAVACEVHC